MRALLAIKLVTIGVILVVEDCDSYTNNRKTAEKLLKKFPDINLNPKVPFGKEILAELDQIRNKKLATAMSFVNGASAYGNGYLRVKAIGEGVEKFQNGDADAALAPIITAAGMLLSFDFFQISTTSVEMLTAIKDGGEAMAKGVGKVLSGSKLEPVRKVHEVAVATTRKVTTKVASFLANEKGVGKVVSSVLNFGKKVIDGLKWLSKLLKIPVAMDILNIYVTFKSLKEAFNAVPRDNDQILIDMFGIAASVVSIGSMVARLWGPAGWVISAGLSAISMLLSFFKPDRPPSPRPERHQKMDQLQITVPISTLKNLGDKYTLLEKLDTDYVRFDYVFVVNMFLFYRVIDKEFSHNKKTVHFQLNNINKMHHSFFHYERTKYKFDKELLHSGPVNEYASKIKPHPGSFQATGERTMMDKEALRQLPYGFLGLRRNDTFQGRTSIFIDKTRRFFGARIETDISNDPQNEFDVSFDDVTIDDIDWMYEGKQIILTLGYGFDVVHVKGRIGDIKEERVKLRVDFKVKNSIDPDDTLSFDTMDNTDKELAALTGLEIFKKVEDKFRVCYKLIGGEASCQIELSVLPRTLVSSNLNDFVHLFSEAPIMVYNCVGGNTYDVSVTREGFAATDLKYEYFIFDTSDTLPVLSISKRSSSHVIYRKKARAIQIYDKDGQRSHLLLQIVFPNKSNPPTSVSFENTNHPIESLPTKPHGMSMLSYTSKNFACFCHKTLTEDERLQSEYFVSFEMGSTFDMVILQRDLIKDSNGYKHKATLVWERITDDEEAEAQYKETHDENANNKWVLQYRTQSDGDPNGIMRRPHFDVVLNYVELLRFDGPDSKILDLTDKGSNFAGLIDLNDWDKLEYNKVVVGGSTDQTVNDGTSSGTFLEVEISTSNDANWRDHGTIDLGDGDNTVLLSSENLAVVNVDVKQAEQITLIVTQDIKIVNEQETSIRHIEIRKGETTVLKVRRVSRLACVYKGITRTAVPWDEYFNEPERQFIASIQRLTDAICPRDMAEIQDFKSKTTMNLKEISVDDDFFHGTKCGNRGDCQHPFA